MRKDDFRGQDFWISLVLTMTAILACLGYLLFYKAISA